MKFPRFSRNDQFWLWYLLIILGIYVIGALIWQTVEPQMASNATGIHWLVNGA